MAAKIGDLVRFLNSTGGGRVVRIDGPVAYVDDDGFETPVMLRECVVVAGGDTFYKSETRAKQPDDRPVPPPPPTSVASHAPELPPIVETPEGERINLVLGFEPIDIKRLSETSFDAFIVNDSNFALYLTVATRANISESWTLRFAGHIEPGTQEFLFELTHDELPYLGHIAVQAIAFKSKKDFTLKDTIAYAQRIDPTKFARLHCFTENAYFEGKVLAFDIVRDDLAVRPHTIDPIKLEQAITEKKQSDQQNRPKAYKSARKPQQIIEIDLHASALLDNLNGLTKADILNFQIDTFRKVMDENLHYPGRKIVFIHGKGEGVLRQALLKELNYRYKGHEVADASFREYGFGATQVTIRHTKKSAT